MQQRNETLPGLLYEANLDSSPSHSRAHSFSQAQSSLSPSSSPPLPSSSSSSSSSSLFARSSTLQLDAEEDPDLEMAPISPPDKPYESANSVSSTTSASLDEHSFPEGAMALPRQSQIEMATYSSAISSSLLPPSPSPPLQPQPSSSSSSSSSSYASAGTGAGARGRGGRNTIKLGLGDFVFYSLLVSRAASFSFASFVACALVVVGGLGATLLLLTLYKKALPALPISILSGCFIYFSFRFFVTPLLDDAAKKAIYV